MLAKLDNKVEDLMLVNENKVVPSQLHGNGGNQSESNLWYLDNGASNHMTGFRSKFTELNDEIT